MALSPAGAAGALILSCYSVEGERDLQAARSDSEHLQSFCASLNITVDVLVEPKLSIQDVEISISKFLSQPLGDYFIFGIFHGQADGAWKLQGGQLDFDAIAKMWIELGRDNFSKTLFLLCDSCFSGQWTRIASERKIPGISVQASCGAAYSCSDDVDDTFTRSWCMFHRQRQGKRQHWKYFFYPYQLDVQQPTYYFCPQGRRPRARFLTQDKDVIKVQLSGIGAQECGEDIMSLMCPPRKPDHTGVVTGTILHYYHKNFGEMWSGKFSCQRIKAKQEDRLQKLGLDHSLRDTVGYLFQLQYISDMKVSYPADNVDDPMKLGLTDLLSFQEDIQTNKQLERAHLSTLLLLAQTWFLQLYTYWLKDMDSKSGSNSSPVQVRAAILQSFHECSRTCQQIQHTLSLSTYDGVLHEEVLLAKVSFHRLLLELDLWPYHRQEKETHSQIRPRIYKELCKDSWDYAQRLWESGWKSESFVHRYTHWCFTALTEKDELTLKKIEREVFLDNDDRVFAHISDGADIDARLRVKFSRLFHGVWFYLHLKYRPELGSTLPSSESVARFVSFETSIKGAVDRLETAVLQSWKDGKNDVWSFWRLDVVRLQQKCCQLSELLQAAAQKPTCCDRSDEVTLLKEVSKQLGVSLMYMEAQDE